MNNTNLVGPWVRRFLMEHLVAERNLAQNTQASYRDALVLLLPFLSKTVKKPVDRLSIEDFSPAVIRRFLKYLENDRGCSVATRNQRLAAIHALSRFIGMHCPEHIAWCSEIRAIPFKKTPKPVMDYLDKPEMDALLKMPARNASQGPRDHALLLFLYNTGARAEETARLIVADLELCGSPCVRIVGKGKKVRYCPLWSSTTNALNRIIAGHDAHEPVFLNRRRKPITRFGIHALVKRYVSMASYHEPSLLTKRVSTHTIRHTTAVHLLRAGVDINTIRAWLGHVSLDTTHIYAEIDLEMKAKALACCEIPEQSTTKLWRKEPGLMAFLKSL
jgi:site-specific recombinase XerD